jgi:hypothetical protein
MFNGPQQGDVDPVDDGRFRLVATETPSRRATLDTGQIIGVPGQLSASEAIWDPAGRYRHSLEETAWEIARLTASTWTF